MLCEEIEIWTSEVEVMCVSERERERKGVEGVEREGVDGRLEMVMLSRRGKALTLWRHPTL
jgi:hypothetical protein